MTCGFRGLRGGRRSALSPYIPPPGRAPGWGRGGSAADRGWLGWSVGSSRPPVGPRRADPAGTLNSGKNAPSCPPQPAPLALRARQGDGMNQQTGGGAGAAPGRAARRPAPDGQATAAGGSAGERARPEPRAPTRRRDVTASRRLPLPAPKRRATAVARYKRPFVQRPVRAAGRPSRSGRGGAFRASDFSRRPLSASARSVSPPAGLRAVRELTERLDSVCHSRYCFPCQKGPGGSGAHESREARQ